MAKRTITSSYTSGNYFANNDYNMSAFFSLMSFYMFLKIKKLVYVYLVRYAEEQQDLALLSISTFQKALKVGRQGGTCLTNIMFE